MYSVNMGRDTFVSSSCDLSLTLHATIDIYFPPGVQTPQDATSLEEALECREIWIDQSAEVQLYLHVDTEPDLRCQLSDFIAEIGHHLCASQMWRYLNLASLFKSCDHHVEGFQLRFGLRETPGPCFPPKSSKVRASTQVLSNYVPPPGIPKAELSTLRISLEYRQSRPLVQLPMPFPQCTTLMPNTLMNVQNTDTFSDTTQKLTKDDGKKPPLWSHIPIPSPRCESPFADELYHMGEEGFQSPVPPYPRLIPLQPDDPAVPPREFYTLFNKGLKRLLAGSPQQEGIQSQGLQSLSRTVPQVFSPGYREAMNQRAQFIPSIARSIASILKASRNTSLHNTFSKLGVSHHSSPGTSARAQDSPEQRTLIQVSLWRIAQKQLFNPYSSRTLNPLDPNPTSCPDAQLLQDTLFDESLSDESPKVDKYYDIDWDEVSDEEELSFDETDTEDESSIIDVDDSVAELPKYAATQHEDYTHQHQSMNPSQKIAQNRSCPSSTNISEDMLHELTDENQPCLTSIPGGVNIKYPTPRSDDNLPPTAKEDGDYKDDDHMLCDNV